MHSLTDEQTIAALMRAIRKPSFDPVWRQEPCAHCAHPLDTVTRSGQIDLTRPLRVRFAVEPLEPGTFIVCIHCVGVNERTADGFRVLELEQVPNDMRPAMQHGLELIREAHRRLKAAS